MRTLFVLLFVMLMVGCATSRVPLDERLSVNEEKIFK